MDAMDKFEDAELEAMRTIFGILKPLDPQVRQRVINWIISRFVESASKTKVK